MFLILMRFVMVTGLRSSKGTPSGHTHATNHFATILNQSKNIKFDYFSCSKASFAFNKPSLVALETLG